MDKNNYNIIQNITILNWNANGVKRQQSTFTNFLYRYQITIACISETHLVRNQPFRIPGYKIYRQDRESVHASGGVAIALKRNLTHFQLPEQDCQSLETIGIQLLLNNNSKLNIIAAYRQPNVKLVKQDIEKIFTKSEPTLLIGDLKIHSGVVDETIQGA